MEVSCFLYKDTGNQLNMSFRAYFKRKDEIVQEKNEYTEAYAV